MLAASSEEKDQQARHTVQAKRTFPGGSLRLRVRKFWRERSNGGEEERIMPKKKSRGGLFIWRMSAISE